MKYDVELIDNEGDSYYESPDYFGTLKDALAWVRAETKGESKVKVRIAKRNGRSNWIHERRCYYATNGRLSLDKITYANTF